MKNTSYLLAFFTLGILLPLRAQNTAGGDAILGTWLTSSGTAHIEIRKFGSTYYGQIVWMKEPNNPDGKPKLDVKNPDAAKRQNPILGSRILMGFTYAGSNKWEDGTIYDPKGGSVYNCKIEMKDPKTLNIRGYVGISLIGRTEVWTRVK